MLKILTKFLLIITISLLIFSSHIIPKETTEAIHTLHSQISNDLAGIGKKLPQAKREVYSILDQVCKMYSLSKGVIEQKNQLEKNLLEQNKEKNALRVKNLSLKNKLLKTEKSLTQYKDDQTSKTKDLEQKDFIIAQLNKEKETLTSMNKKLELEKKELKLKLNTLQASDTKTQDPAKLAQDDTKKEPEYLNKIYNTNMKQRNNKLAFNEEYNIQSLNLTSTSDPMSPL